MSYERSLYAVHLNISALASFPNISRHEDGINGQDRLIISTNSSYGFSGIDDHYANGQFNVTQPNAESLIKEKIVR